MLTVVFAGLVPPGPTELSPKILLQLETDLIQSKYAAYDELLRACQRCDPDGVQRLFDQEGDALVALGIIKDRYGRTPLHFVCLGSASNRQDQLVTLEKLLRFFSQEQYINAEDYFGNTAVDVAAKSGDFHIVNRFLEAGARVTGRTLVLATEGGVSHISYQSASSLNYFHQLVYRLREDYIRGSELQSLFDCRRGH